MVAGGAEELCPSEVAVFDTLFAASTRNDEPELTPRPFDANRDGLVIGEGACTLVLEELEHARARGARIHAELVGFATNCDATHITQPNSKTMRICMEEALRTAGLAPSDIGYLSAHGTATSRGDCAESNATASLFGNRTPVSSLKSYIARKVQNDEVTYIANAFAFDKVDVNSKDVIMSPDLIEHAIKTGHYKPAKAGDYSDFSFRKAYQPIERRSADWNKDRAQTAWEMLMGKETMDQEAFPYSVKPTKKLTVSDVQKIVSGHWKREARTSGFFHQSMRDICNVGTFESVVYEMNPEPLLTRGWRTSARPCQTPYVPFFPLAKPAEAQSFMTPEVATAEHFHATPDRFDFKADFGLYTALKTQNLVDYLDDGARADLRKVIDAQQAKWLAEGDSVLKTAQYLEKNVSQDKAKTYLHQYAAEAYNVSIALLEDAFQNMKPLKIEILADTLSLSKKDKVDVVVFGEKGLDLSKAKKESFVFGITYPDPNVDVNLKRAKATKMALKDVNGDGVKDLVLTFPSDEAAKYGFEGVNTDLWLFGEIDGQKKGGFDLVRIVK